MAARSLRCPRGALLLLALLLLPLELGRADGGRGWAPSGVLSLPLVQALLRQAPPSARPRRQAGGPPLRYMLELYRSVADRHGRPRKNRQLTANTVRLVRPFAKTRQPGAGPGLGWSLDYRLDVRAPLEQLVRATLVYARTRSSAHGPLLCTAELLPGQGGAAPRLAPTPTGRRAAPRPTPPRDSWVEMDLSAQLQPWAWAARESRVLQLSQACVSRGLPGAPTPGPGGGEEAVAPDDPFLLLYLNDSGGRGLVAELGGLEEAPPREPAHLRSARQAGALALDLPSSSSSSSSSSNRSSRPGRAQSGECALHPFRVSFSQLGWDHWIIAPHWYRPQYCKGRCPRVLPAGLHAPNHAIVQSLINELVDPAVPRPSCVPHEYRPISVLMLEPSGDILYKVYEDMIARSCTCR